MGVETILRARSASASSITPLSEESRPPSNTAVTFLRVAPHCHAMTDDNQLSFNLPSVSPARSC
jgi:hypothetical protein